MNDTSREVEALLKVRYAAMSRSDRALMALQMFESAQQIVLSSEPGMPSVSESSHGKAELRMGWSQGCGEPNQAIHGRQAEQHQGEGFGWAERQ